MSQQVIKRTQDMLGKYVSKPPLSDKLLGKPPFRYLHDILNVVIKEHGFLDGLYTDQELSSENIKDKDAKIAFLQKWIDATSIAVGENLNVKPSKIVAGHEADNTNLLLQAVAKGLDKKIDSKDAVKQVLSQSSKGSRKEKPKTDSKKEKSSTSKPKALPVGDKNPPKKESSGSKNPKKEPTPAARKPPTNNKNPISVKDQKDTKPSDKAKGKEKKDGGSRSKSKDPKKEKEKDEKSKSKTKSSESSKSKKAEVPPKKEKEKENAPPLPPPSEAEIAVEDTADDIMMSQEEPSIPKSAGSVKSLSAIAQDPDDFFAADLPLENEIPTLVSDEGFTADEPISDEPTSLLNNAVELAEEENELPPPGLNTLPLYDDSQVDDEHNLHQINSASRSRPQSEIDPAILKAMGGNEMRLGGGDPFNEVTQNEPSDSGVGSLESPKVNTKIESLPNVAESKPSSPVPIPPTPGPRPPTLKGYHPDLPNYDPGTDDIFNSQADEPPERPKTGMSIRPRTGRKSARPPSARPAPPKVRERREIPQEEIPRPPTGKPVPNVILDSDNKNEDDDEEDENFTVGSTKPVLDDESIVLESSKDPNLEKNKQELLEGDQDAKGILVAQILETKKELEDNRREAFSPETPGHRRVPIEHAFQGDAGRKKEKELIQKDVEKLTSSIQALTRSVNPLAKMLDYLQEDFDSMQKELETWRSENKTLSQSLKAEQSLTDQQLEPLNQQLEEMESAIYDQHDRISAIKSLILRNDERTTRLLAGINIKS